MIYYNEFDRHAAAWLRELGNAGEIELGEVDERSIADVTPDDVRRYTRCHWFAGIGGWDYALRLAGWPADRPVWTGSCPCQPYSAAGKRKGHKDERDLWPTFFNLIKEVRPPVIFGEQVASSDVVGSSVEAAFVDAVQRGDYARANKLAKRVVTQPAFHAHPRWLTRVRTDMEGIGYTVRWKILGAHSVLSPHIRQRLYWVADAGQLASRDANPGKDFRESYQPQDWRGKANDDVAGRFGFGRLANAEHSQRRSEYDTDGEAHGRDRFGRCGTTGRMEHTTGDGRDERRAESFGRSIASGCRDGGIGDAIVTGLEGHSGDVIDGDEPGRYGTNSPRPIAQAGSDCGPWSDYQFIPCRDGKARRLPRKIKPDIVILADGLWYNVDDVLSEFITQATKEVISHAKIAGTDAKKMLSLVRSEYGKEAFQRQVGGQGGFFTEEILFDFLRDVLSALERTTECGSSEKAGSKADERMLRDLRVIVAAECSSLRRESEKQQEGQPTNIVFVLSQFLARCCKACRSYEARKDASAFPLVDGMKNRVGLLRGYGNAIVPQVAAAFIRAFLETESGVIP